MPQINMMKRVYIASPYRTNSHEQRRTFDSYLEMCIRDSFSRGEAPYAPHYMYPPFMCRALTDAQCRNAADKYLAVCDKIAFYIDFDISPGMQDELDFAKAMKKPIEMRKIQ